MRKLEDELVKNGLLSKEDLEKALNSSVSSRSSLAEILINRGMVSEENVLRTLGDIHGIEFIRLADMTIDSQAIKTMPAKFAAHYGIMPVKTKAGVLTIAVSNPFDTTAVGDIESNIGIRVERMLACKSDIALALSKYYGVGADTVERILAESPDREEMVTAEESHDLEKTADDASVIKLVNQIMQDAINDRATDIHFEAYRDGISVRRRIDGILYETPVPKNIKLLYPSIISRIKLMSGLNIVERRLPQDGRSRVSIGAREYDLRISVVPAMHGEDVVIRILPSTMLFDLTKIGFSADQLNYLNDMLNRPHGIVFVTGPTGSGKSTTLYACLSKLNTRDLKIITIEDPIEYELRGITQTQIRPSIGLTFSSALRSMLRHDPDIMMVGEVRDKETAEIAIQTAMTGHLVLSTLHTNDSASSAVRLIDMGIDPYLIASTVQVFIAQRLVRTICDKCKTSYVKDGKKSYKGKGCRSCSNTGYHGRIAICEFMPLTSEIQNLILDKVSAKQIREKADSLGMNTLAQDGWLKVEAGITTIDEVMRVTTV